MVNSSYPAINRDAISKIVLGMGIGDFFISKKGKNGAVAITKDKVYKTASGFEETSSVVEEFLRERWVLETLTNTNKITSVNTPKLVGVINDNTLIQTRVPGKPLSFFIKQNSPTYDFFSALGQAIADFSIEFNDVIRKQEAIDSYRLPRLLIEPSRLTWDSPTSQKEEDILNNAKRRIEQSKTSPLPIFRVHCDLNDNNLLYDENTNRFGIVDFGMVKKSPIEDVVWRLMANFDDYGQIAIDSFTNRLYEKIGYKTDKDLVVACASNSVYFALALRQGNYEKRSRFIKMYDALPPTRPRNACPQIKLQQTVGAGYGL